SDAVHLRELFLGTFECGSGAMRIRLSLPAKSGAVAYVKIRPWRNPLASVVPPLGDQRRVILDNDGYSAFCVRMMETPAAMARYSALYRQTAIRGVVWCIGNLSEVNYTSGVAPYTFQGVASLAAPSHARVRNALEAYARSGEDTLDAHLRIMRDGNLFSLTSLRVQHVPNPAYDKGRSFPFYDTHEQWRIHNRQGQLLKPLSYANAGVRDRALAIVDEVLARGPDVFLLELTRGVPFVGYHPDLLREYRKRVPGPELSPPKDDRDPHWLAVKNGPMTMLMRAIRNAADRHGKRLGRRIRIGAHVDNMGFRSEGIDLATWVDEGLVDMLVAGIGHGSDTITPVVDVAASRRLPVYGHIHAHFGGKDPTPDEERARARGIRMPRTGGGVERDYFMAKAFKLYSQGAAGIYIWDGFFYPAVADLVGDPDRVAQWYWLERPTRSFSLNVKTGK
ncbi:MAG: hypothetical protein KAI66_10930, partial [Lentisphaeria bacterium]|nr:hypothetical protein [Lentisphaeria bacterium]